MIGQLTEEELIAYLKHSSIDTILVEGVIDMFIYRHIEESIDNEKVNILSCGGRNTLMNIYKRRDEISNIKLIFVADKDIYVYVGVPEGYDDIIWTTGYSIENDLYFGGFLEALLNKSEKENFKKALGNFITEYAQDIARIVEGIETKIDYHPQCKLNDKYELINEPTITPEVEYIISALNSHYSLLIRGKSLFQLLFLFLCKRERAVKHSKSSLMEMCIKFNNKNLVEKIIGQIIERIDDLEEAV